LTYISGRVESTRTPAILNNIETAVETSKTTHQYEKYFKDLDTTSLEIETRNETDDECASDVSEHQRNQTSHLASSSSRQYFEMGTILTH